MAKKALFLTCVVFAFGAHAADEMNPRKAEALEASVERRITHRRLYNMLQKELEKVCQAHTTADANNAHFFDNHTPVSKKARMLGTLIPGAAFLAPALIAIKTGATHQMVLRMLLIGLLTGQFSHKLINKPLVFSYFFKHRYYPENLSIAHRSEKIAKNIVPEIMAVWADLTPEHQQEICILLNKVLKEIPGIDTDLSAQRSAHQFEQLIDNLFIIAKQDKTQKNLYKKSKEKSTLESWLV